MAVIPMFPLGTTVLPGAGVPLQVFEPRYLQLVHDLLASDEPPAFGTVLIERGQEVGGDDDRNPVGTLIRVADMRVTDDGRYLIAGVGIERIRVERWLPDDPYPRAEADVWPDEPSDAEPAVVAGLVAEATAKAVALGDRVRALGHALARPDEGLDDDVSIALFQLASRSPLGSADRYRILSAPSVVERCVALTQALDDAMAVIDFHRS